MFITKKHIARRTVLKAAGVKLALPFLEAMVPAATALAQTAAAPKMRAAFFYLPHGAIMYNTSHGPAMDKWTPSGSGAEFKLSPILSPLEPYKKYVNSFGNLENAATAGSVHTFTPATWLSATRPDTGGPRAHMSVTLDQVIAKFIGQETPLPSLELASETIVQTAAGGGGSYTTLSFRDAESPLPMEYNPRKVFLQLFGEGDTPQERAAIGRQTNSMLDLMLDRTKKLQGDLGPGDRAALDGYLESVREIERRTQKAGAHNLSGLKIPDAPLGELEDFAAQVKLMFDLLALAFQADLTRVATYIMVAEGTNRTYNHIGVPDAFHPVSHHANDLERINKLAKIQTWHVEKFAEFVKKMAETKDGEGTLLDHSIFMYGSNMSNSDLHNNYPEPNIIVGGGNGKVKLGGQHIVLPERTPIANLHLTLLQKAGLERDKFGDSTGTIAGV
ncbi:MAG: DUF1552 domain-containing protein [Bryobacterales bacterium]|nr:DUF1552 domain-containing protein [Bryobacterales bacterium]MBV9396809.1 DUF1552 domain-containing protein [Bryobacterales bacterium]